MQSEEETTSNALREAAREQYVRLPRFWTKNPIFYFHQVEQRFILRNITSDDTKYALIIDSLSQEDGEKIQSLLRSPPTENKYETLKSKLLQKFQVNKHSRARQLLNLPPMGDQTPSEVLIKMKSLMAEDDYKMLFDEIFLAQLPESIRQELSKPGAMDDLDEAGQLADQLYSETDLKLRQEPQIQALSQSRGSFAPRRPRGGFRGRYRGQFQERRYENQRYGTGNANPRYGEQPNARYCINHQRYGSNCYKCLGNCAFNTDNAIKAIAYEDEEIQGNDNGEL